MSTVSNGNKFDSYYLLNINANFKVNIEDGLIIGRFSDPHLPQYINRKLARIELIKNHSNINNHIGYLILLKNYIKINDKEFTFNDNIKPIPIHIGDILYLIRSGSKQKQYKLEICRNVNDKHILNSRNRKRKRSEQFLSEPAQSNVYNNNINNSRISMVNNTKNKTECHHDPPKKKRKLNHDINAIVPDLSTIDEDDEVSLVYKFEEKSKPKPKNHDKKDILPNMDESDDNDDNDNDNDDEVISQIVTTQPEDDQIANVTDTDIDESDEEQENDQDILMKEDNDKIYTFLDGVYGLLVPTKTEYKVMEIKKDEFKIGRHIDNDLVLSKAWISGFHCEIQNNRLRSKKILLDTSTNGTFVNGKKINGEHSLQNGDLIQFQFREVDDNQNMKIRSISYYFILLELFDQNANYTKDEFNVTLNKSKESKGKYNLYINDKMTVYTEKEYDQEQLSKLIHNLTSIPEDLSKEITKFYGNMMETISYNIACKRPIHRTDKPFLPRSSAMLGSPIDPNDIN